MEHVKAMVGFGPRPSGSAALLKNRDYIKAEIEKLGLKAELQDWTDPPSKLRMHNIWTQIPGKDPEKGPIVMFCAHYDTKLCEGHEKKEHNFPFVGAIDGAGGSSVLLELARHLKDRKNGPNIWLLWVDGEESIPWDWNKDNSQALHGSKYFVKTMTADKKRFPDGMASRVRAFVLIDLVGSKNQKIDRDLKSHRILNEIFKATGEAMGEGDRMFATESETTDDHLPFQQAGIKVIDLIDFAYRVPGEGRPKHPDYDQWWHTEKDNLEAMDPVSLAFVGNLLWNGLPRIEDKLCPDTK